MFSQLMDSLSFSANTVVGMAAKLTAKAMRTRTPRLCLRKCFMRREVRSLGHIKYRLKEAYNDVRGHGNDESNDGRKNDSSKVHDFFLSYEA